MCSVRLEASPQVFCMIVPFDFRGVFITCDPWTIGELDWATRFLFVFDFALAASFSLGNDTREMSDSLIIGHNQRIYQVHDGFFKQGGLEEVFYCTCTVVWRFQLVVLVPLSQPSHLVLFYSESLPFAGHVLKQPEFLPIMLPGNSFPDRECLLGEWQMARSSGR